METLIVVLLFAISIQTAHINRKVNKVMATQKDEAATLTAIAAEVGKIGDGIDQLEAALAAAGNTTPEVDAALANLQAAADAALAKLPAPPTPTPSPPPA